MQRSLPLALLALACLASAPSARADATTPPSRRPPAPSRKEPAPAPGSCMTLRFDVKSGTMNGVAPTASQAEVMRALPCFTGHTDESEKWLNHGGGVFFIKHDFFFYTGKDFLEVRADFSGQVTDNLLGRQRADVLRALGTPMRAEQDTLFFRTAYGCLRVEVSGDDKVREIGAHHGACEKPR